MEKIIILGKGGHAESLVDIIEKRNQFEIAGYIVNDNSSVIGDKKYPVIGKDIDLERIYQSGIKYAALGIGYLGKADIREWLWNRLKQIGFILPSICDISAILASKVILGEGCFVGKGTIINSNTLIGKMCIINTGAIIEHDCKIGDFSHISVGSVLCGGVQVGKESFIGANATVIQGRTIGNKCIVGAGVTIRKNIEDNSIVRC